MSKLTASEGSIDQMSKRSALSFCLLVVPQGSCLTKYNQLHLKAHSLSIEISEKICSQISTFSEDKDLYLRTYVKRNPRRRKYSKNRNKERMTWVGIDGYERRGIYTRKNLKNRKL